MRGGEGSKGRGKSVRCVRRRDDNLRQVLGVGRAAEGGMGRGRGAYGVGMTTSGRREGCMERCMEGWGGCLGSAYGLGMTTSGSSATGSMSVPWMSLR